MRVLNDRDEIKAAEGTELGVSTWLEISQERIDMFADATGDHQWIHVDPHKAATGPFGATVAHGYLTLSLIPFLGAQAFAFAGETARVNYGLDRVRFMSPVRVGSRIRDRVVLSKVNEIERGQQVQLTHTIEIEGVEKPACVAEAIVLLMDS
ncbi:MULTISPECIES: MaoC family dehydratase [Aeromicrobium]|jgi:acyl dehydratase|uniref:MaoC family dehydratase n=1 Tax=Aeromicrobium TaxID=2040 RepID=UPI0005785DD0|nr:MULTISPECIES: MaoC family dehydratase [Aeromicrobium]TCI97836.1 MaoC family dehydratase [Aeromicrobium sp. IC_218]